MNEHNVPPPTHESTLPEVSESNVNATFGLWCEGFKASARRWVSPAGVDLVTVTLGAFNLTVSPAQWDALAALVDDAVRPGAPKAAVGGYWPTEKADAL